MAHIEVEQAFEEYIEVEAWVRVREQEQVHVEWDQELELALHKVAVLEQRMVEEQVQVCAIERIKKNNV